MKKQLLIASALLTTCGVFAQQPRVPEHATIVDLASRLAKRYEMIERVEEKTRPSRSQNGTQSTAQQKSAATTWQAFSASMNAYGMLVSHSKPLQYNKDLNAVTFIHRKSPSYQVSANGNSGSIVSMVSSNFGQTWDSTCIWASGTNLGRYPQGGIYNPPGNTSIANAYIVGTGPVTGGSGWLGSWAASKQLGTYNNTPSAAPNAQQFWPSTPPYPASGKVDFPRYDFTSTSDGLVRSIGTIVNDVNGTTNATYAWRGARVMKGTFTSGVFNWSGDSIIPALYVNANTGAKMVYGGYPHMAWNEAGTVGYVWFIGVINTTVAANRGYQPVIYKTTNGGQSWSLMPRIDFAAPNMSVVIDGIAATNNTTIAIPFFNHGEGCDAIVDKNDKLHLVSTIVGTARAHVDSVGYTWNYNNFDNESYSFPHQPGARPYIYDFTETATGWNVMVVDSMSSESPGNATGDNGYADNPWLDNAGSKISVDARIQLSRTTNGSHIVYTWTESDTNFTNQGRKWNHIPDIKARVLEVGAPATSYQPAARVHTLEVNITKPNSGGHPRVQSAAFLNYVSPKCAVTTNSAASSYTVRVPMTVSNSVPLDELSPNQHFYSTVELIMPVSAPISTTSIQYLNTESFELYPNPAQNTVYVTLNTDAPAQISVLNVIGQEVRSYNVSDKNLALDIQGLQQGIYMIQVTQGTSTISKKLIID